MYFYIFIILFHFNVKLFRSFSDSIFGIKKIIKMVLNKSFDSHVRLVEKLHLSNFDFTSYVLHM